MPDNKPPAEATGNAPEVQKPAVGHEKEPVLTRKVWIGAAMMVLIGIAVGAMVGETETEGITAAVVGAVLAAVTGLTAIAKNFGDMSADARNAREGAVLASQIQIACLTVAIAVSALAIAYSRTDQNGIRPGVLKSGDIRVGGICDMTDSDDIRKAITALPRADSGKWNAAVEQLQRGTLGPGVSLLQIKDFLCAVVPEE